MKTDNISSKEWWWVALVSGLLVTLTLLPYAWALTASDEVFQFMGILPNPKDGATYISKIQQGVDGQWLFELRHTPEKHDPAGLHLFYLLLGHIGRFTGLSDIVMFHAARLMTSFFMFFALYQLGGAIWQRLRPRRLFFLFTSLGSGLGWLALMIFGTETLAPDLIVGEAFPLLAAYTNPHFPLTIGCLALITAQSMTVFRPGYDDAPTSDNGGLLLLLLSIILAIVSPPALLMIGGTLISFTMVRALLTRSVPYHEMRWAAMVVLPGVPFAFYYWAVFNFNEIMNTFNQQNVTPAPNIILTIMGYGVLLGLGIPAIMRALRSFERDGDQLMLVWVVFTLVAVYLPVQDVTEFSLQRRLFIGLIIPLAYFAVRAVEAYWIDRLPQRWHFIALLAIFILMFPTHFLTFAAPLFSATVNREDGENAGIVVDRDYIEAFNWLSGHSQRDEVILSAPVVGLWVPARTPLRPVYGHEFETVPAEERLDNVRAFYRGEDCETLLEGLDLPFRVQYVLWGPKENALGGDTVRRDDINPILSDPLPVPGSTRELEQTEPNPRLPDADRCHEAIIALAAEQMTFGDVTLYILPRD